MIFRPGEDLEPGELPVVTEPAPPALSFTQAAEAGGTDLDVLMGYQMFLGRDPENSFVIADSKTSPVGAFIRGLMGSGEFQSAVLDRLPAGRVLPHEAGSVAPSAEQVDWLLRHVGLPAPVMAALRSAPDWRRFLATLTAVPGFPRPPSRGGAEPAAEVAAQAAGEGFVLIHLEEPKAGERLTPGMVVNGSGWAIAPADIVEVAVHVDETLLTHARYGLPRPDVARNFPHYRHVDHCGFSFSAELPDGEALHEASQLIVSVRTAGGDVGRRALRLEPPADVAGQRAEAAGAWPMRLSVEEATLDEARRLRVRGTVLSRAALRGVQVFFGDAALGEARHSLPRPDMARSHPGYPQAGQCGFAFSGELGGELPQAGGFVRVQAGDVEGQTRQAIVPVVLSPLQDDPGAGASSGASSGRSAQEGASGSRLRLEIDSPAFGRGDAPVVVHGSLTIIGWAAGRERVDHVDVLVDGKLLDRATTGMRREDIFAAFPEYEAALTSGFAIVLTPGTLPEGTHVIRTVAHGGGALAERSFEVHVEPLDTLPPGAAIRAQVPPAEVEFVLGLLARASCRPSFAVSVDMPGPDGDALADLAATLDSLARQAYPDWTASVLLADGVSPASARAVVKDRDRVRLEPKAAGAGTPETADFWMRLRPGDLLGADALLAFAAASVADPLADLLYADDVRPDRAHGRKWPFLKPDWSPELLLSTNYVGRAWCARAALVRRSGLAAEEDYAAVLLLTEHAGRIAHVPRVLCEQAAGADTAAQEQAALTDALGRRGVSAAVLPGKTAGTWRVRRERARPGRERAGVVPGLVSIIMPTCGARGLVRLAVRTIRATTAPKRPDGVPVEIVLLDNTPAGDTATKAWLRRNADTLVDMPGPFNWSRFNNVGARAAKGEYLLFLNDDIEAREPGWLEALLEQAQRPEVGVAGPRLLYPDGRVQHGGLYLADNHARHAFRFTGGPDPGAFGFAGVTREVIAVTGACQIMHRRVFKALGGFEEAHSVVNNDLDFCLRSWRADLSVVVTPHATLIHHELASRASLEDSYDAARFAGTWRTRFLLGDPFRNPNIDAFSDAYAPTQEPTQLLHVGRRGPRREEVRRILAVKLDHIGDFLTALPALRALRRGFPHARIDLLAPQASAELARRQDLIDDVAVFDFFHVRSGEGRKRVDEAEFEALRSRLAPAGYDMAIDLRMQPETRVVLPYTGARFLVGYDYQDRFPFLDVALVWESDFRLIRKRAHISQRLEDLVSAVLDACRDPGPLPQAAPLEAGAVPALARLPPAFRRRPIVCVHPGVGNPMRQWPAASFAGLVDLLVAEAGVSVVLVGAAVEAEVADEVLRLSASKGDVESLVGRVKLAELPEVMRACVLFVGNNSGPQHLAASLGVPTVGVHSAVVDAVEWAPLGAQAVAVQRRMVCGPCYLEFASECPRNLACLTGLRPAEVFSVCRTLLAGGRALGETAGKTVPADGSMRRIRKR